jgi:urea transport system substrate-binding protein
MLSRSFRRAVLILSAIVLVIVAGFALARGLRPSRSLRVGVLHSSTGTMALSEKPLIDAVRLAIDEVNQAGGVLGARVEPVVADGRSDPAAFAREAERLIVDEAVCTIFGCWTSASRKAVRPVVERHDHLLLYPVQYEGAEQSPNIFYLGAAPNQQIVPTVRWAAEHLGKRFFLVGSDYVFPRVASAIIRDQVAALGGQIVGERYLPLGAGDAGPVAAEVARARPSAVLNLINGDTNITFFRALRAAGITPRDVPVLSFSIAEPELQTLPLADLAGDYAAWNYFQSIDTPANRRFVERFQARYGNDRVTSDPIEAAYVAVHLWAQAVQAAHSTSPAAIRLALCRQSLAAPGGVIAIDADTQHAWKTVRIGRIQPNGQFAIVWDSSRPVRPVPFPLSRPRSDWLGLLDRLHRDWGGQWVNPRSTP